MVSRLFDEIGYHLWLQGPLNHLSGEQRINYITTILQEILELLKLEPFFHFFLHMLMVFVIVGETRSLD
jgi:hypothetical protein